MTAPLRLGLVGCGRLAELGHVPAAARTDGVTIAAVADPDAQRRAHVAGVAGDVPAYADLAGLLAAETVDAVVLATPAAAHVDDARLAASAGLPTLVEKPPAADLAGALALAALHPAPFVAFNRRFDPALDALRADLGAGGALDVDLELRYRRASWGAHVIRDEVLLDLGPHLVDLAIWLTGAPVRRVRVEHRSADRAVLALGGDRGRIRVACAADRPYLERFAVQRDGRRVGVVRRGGLVRGVLDRFRPGGAHPLQDGLALELAAFARAVRGGPSASSPLGTAAEGAAVMAVLDAARSPEASGGDWLAVPDLPPTTTPTTKA